MIYLAVPLVQSRLQFIIIEHPYWSHWTKRTPESILPAKSWVCPGKLESLAIRLGYTNRDALEKVLERLKTGADLGCRGSARLATRMPNGPTAHEHGSRLLDELQSWVKEGIAWGPLRAEEIPWSDYSCNPLQVRIKPSGSARIIVNFSSPYAKEGDGTDSPASVNSGINKEEFPATMASTESFLISLMLAGCPAEMCKLDWRSAYKHQHVRMEDLKLQVFEFGGRLFGEVMLVFGGVSSAGIYNDLASMVLSLVILFVGVDERLVNKVLDDVVACGPKGCKWVGQFYKGYREVANMVGVSLASDEDPDKAFNVTHHGKVLGIMYDLKAWQWWITDDKLIPILNLLAKVRDSKQVRNEDMLSLNGKLTHYRMLVPGGAWERGFLLRLQDARQAGNVKFEVSDLARKQASWWMIHLRVARECSTIPDPRPMACMLVRKAFSDAAGGSINKIKNGVGGVCYPSTWFYMPWPTLIRENRENSLGVRFSHKLSCLEGFGSLVALTTVPDLARNSAIDLPNDNSGFVAVFGKKHSSCPYLYTVAKAIHDVAVGLNCKVTVTKTGRCSGQGEVTADALSKGEWDSAWKLMPDMNVDPAFIPRVLLKWIANPVPDMELGFKVLAEMSAYTKVLHMKE